jgi:hypothetical protein
MGDTCCLPFSMGAVKNTIEDHVPGAYVTSLMIGSNEGEDQLNGENRGWHEKMPLALQMPRVRFFGGIAAGHWVYSPIAECWHQGRRFFPSHPQAARHGV